MAVQTTDRVYDSEIDKFTPEQQAYLDLLAAEWDDLARPRWHDEGAGL